MFHVSKILISSNHLSFQQAAVTTWWTVCLIQWKFYIRGCREKKQAPQIWGVYFHPAGKKDRRFLPPTIQLCPTPRLRGAV